MKNGNFLYPTPSPQECLLGYLGQLLQDEQLESAAEVLVQLAEESQEIARAGFEKVAQHGQLDRLLAIIGEGEGWMRLARASVVKSLRSLASSVAQADPVRFTADDPRVDLFGPLQVTYQGRVLKAESWPSSKALRLFACLVARQGTPLSCSAAIEMLWPELCSGRGRSSLRNCLYQIRFALRDLLGLPGAGVVRCRLQDTLVLERRFDTDVRAYEEAVEQAYAAPPSDAFRLASRADDLYRASFLEGMEDAWIGPVRARLSGTQARLLHLLAHCQLDLGQARGAELTARRALQDDDLSEQAWADLLAAQVGQGRESEARRLYREAVAHFEDEMGFRPSSLGEAYDRLLAPPAYQKVS